VNFHIDADYQSEFYFDLNKNPFAIQQGYIIWNTSVAWEMPIGLWVLGLKI